MVWKSGFFCEQWEVKRYRHFKKNRSWWILASLFLLILIFFYFFVIIIDIFRFFKENGMFNQINPVCFKFFITNEYMRVPFFDFLSIRHIYICGAGCHRPAPMEKDVCHYQWQDCRAPSPRIEEPIGPNLLGNRNEKVQTRGEKSLAFGFFSFSFEKVEKISLEWNIGKSLNPQNTQSPCVALDN